VVCLAAGTAGAAANFDGDVNTAINRGLSYLDGLGYYSAYPTCSGIGGMRGLPLLALLEKRASGNLNDPPQGYVGASEDDKAKMRNAVACILDDANTQSEYAYYYGNWLMALSLYARTGGPGKGAPGIPDSAALLDLVPAIGKLTDGLIAAQGKPTTPPTVSNGMWSYSGAGDDSSTSQFAAAGLAGAKAYYISNGDFGGRLPDISAALAAAGTHYADFGKTGSDNSACGVVEASERGHGYHTNYKPSLQQTSSGMWLQLLGGANVNDPGVQAYLRWLRNHYRWEDLDNMGNSWSYYSYYYYLWSSMKGLLTIQSEGIVPAEGNLGANSLGTLPPDESCSVRQVHKDPATVSQPAVFGAGGAGFYAAESQSTYFDYAHTLMNYQCADGDFDCNGAPSSWEGGPDRAAWALLVLQRSTGGACADSNNDGVCDGEGEAPPPSYSTCDVNGSGNVTVDDVWALLPFAKARTAWGAGNAVPPGVAAGDATAFEPTGTSTSWFGKSADNEINVADFVRCIFRANGR
jgi:hypothetical protein